MPGEDLAKLFSQLKTRPGSIFIVSKSGSAFDVELYPPAKAMMLKRKVREAPLAIGGTFGMEDGKPAFTITMKKGKLPVNSTLALTVKNLLGLPSQPQFVEDSDIEDVGAEPRQGQDEESGPPRRGQRLRLPSEDTEALDLLDTQTGNPRLRQTSTQSLTSVEDLDALDGLDTLFGELEGEEEGEEEDEDQSLDGVKELFQEPEEEDDPLDGVKELFKEEDEEEEEEEDGEDEEEEDGEDEEEAEEEAPPPVSLQDRTWRALRMAQAAIEKISDVGEMYKTKGKLLDELWKLETLYKQTLAGENTDRVGLEEEDLNDILDMVQDLTKRAKDPKKPAPELKGDKEAQTKQVEELLQSTSPAVQEALSEEVEELVGKTHPDLEELQALDEKLARTWTQAEPDDRRPEEAAAMLGKMGELSTDLLKLRDERARQKKEALAVQRDLRDRIAAIRKAITDKVHGDPPVSWKQRTLDSFDEAHGSFVDAITRRDWAAAAEAAPDLRVAVKDVEKMGTEDTEPEVESGAETGEETGESEQTG